MNKVLVTGGCGFIGSKLTRRLVGRGFDVVVLDNLIRSNTDEIADLIESGKVHFVDGDVRYEDAVSSAMSGCDYVFHEAAVCINRSMAFPKESTDINFCGSQVVFSEALKQKVKRVVFASSASVYGNPQKLPMAESDELNPITPYCVSKLASEFLLKFYARQGLQYNILRYFNVYGPGQKTDAYYTSVVIAFVNRILSGKPPLIDGDGSQSMDFVHVDDVVTANLLAMDSNAVNEVFNVGTGKSTTIKELAELLLRQMGSASPPQFSNRKSIVARRRADMFKAKEKLGFEAGMDLSLGMKQVVDQIVSRR